MNIVHIVHGKANPNEHNGISRVVYFLNKHEKMQGHNSQIWAVVDGQKKHETYKREEFVTVEMFSRVTYLNSNSAESICRYIQEHKDEIDIIHFHMIWFIDKNIIAGTIKKCNIPIVITTHGTYSKPHARTGKRLFAKMFYEVKYLNNATEIHALQPDETYGNYKYGVRVPQFVVPNGIEKNEIPQIRNAELKKQYNDKIVLLWVGVFRGDKNLEQLLEAVSMVPADIRSNILLVLAGPDNKNNKAKLKELATNLGIAEQVIFKDAVYNQEKYDLLESADVYIMPSLSEGMSMAILDALACGKPCILTKQCGMEYYLAKDFFFMCEPFAQDIKRAICEMYEHKDRLGEMGRNSLKMINDCFNWEQVTREMIKNYERIVKNNAVES